MDVRVKVPLPEGTDGRDYSYRQKIVDRYKAAAKTRNYLNGFIALAMMFHPTVLLFVLLPNRIVGADFDIHNVPIIATNTFQFLVVLICAHATRQLPSKEQRVLKLTLALILAGAVNVYFALVLRFRAHPEVVDRKKVSWIGAISIEKVMKKLIGAKRCEKIGVSAGKMHPALAQLEVFGELMGLAIPFAIRGMTKALISHGSGGSVTKRE